MRVHARDNTCNTGCNALQSVQHVQRDRFLMWFWGRSRC